MRICIEVYFQKPSSFLSIPWGMTVRPTVTPAMRSEIASLRLYWGNQVMIGSADFIVEIMQSNNECDLLISYFKFNIITVYNAFHISMLNLLPAELFLVNMVSSNPFIRMLSIQKYFMLIALLDQKQISIL